MQKKKEFSFEEKLFFENVLEKNIFGKLFFEKGLEKKCFRKHFYDFFRINVLLGKILNRISSIVNRQSSIVNFQSSIANCQSDVNRQSSIINRQSSIGTVCDKKSCQNVSYVLIPPSNCFSF